MSDPRIRKGKSRLDQTSDAYLIEDIQNGMILAQISMDRQQLKRLIGEAVKLLAEKP